MKKELTTHFRSTSTIVAIGLVLIGGTTAGQNTLTLDTVIARASAYVVTYVENLSNVVMEEEYQQTYFRGDGRPPAHSELVSEFLLMRVEADAGQWIGFRDVFELNGRMLRDRQDRLASLFLARHTNAFAQARRISEESARYNLGSTDRTFNVPTYALFFLHPTNRTRFRFEQDGQGCAGVDPAWEVTFEEITYPTMARGYQGISLPARGRFCLDPQSGLVYESQLQLNHPRVGGDRPATDASARVTFELEPRLQLWVPVEMRDSVSEQGGSRMVNTARYRNYRQFNVIVTENTDPATDDAVTGPQ
ncbi:MAG: hypothetical protein VYE68_13015 [Acidobacteriota bacterium]|nr:hypothetical protein [Acidobacteriota bacterium]